MTTLQNQRIERVLESLSKSNFRSKFSLKEKDKEYVREKGIDVIEEHTRDLIEKRISPAFILNSIADFSVFKIITTSRIFL